MIPKFRGYSEALGYFVEGSFLYTPEATSDFNIMNWIVRKDGFKYAIEKPSSIGQSTGLKDKNGVEIFEGDEIELTHSDLEGETIYSKAIAKAPMDYTLEEAVALNHAHEIELTGKNIYENTELLEVAE